MIYFTSDLHFWHKNIIKYCNRPYQSTEEMNEALITNWNSVVRSTDKVFLLGDIFFCNEEEAAKILSRLNGFKHLVLGNHDRVIKKSEMLLSMFDGVLPDLHVESINGQKTVMCHYPMMSWIDRSRGSYMLHGHSHNTIPFDPTVRRLDVGVDAHNMYPVSWDEIQQKLNAVKFAAG